MLENCRAMPWEKSFDELDAIDRAMMVFWEKGFESASITDLVKKTGINKGSLYNAFGGKQSLFVKALLHYDENRKSLLAKFEVLDDPKAAIKALIDETVNMTINDPDRKGCFLFNTALDIGVHEHQVQDIVANGVKEIEAFVRRCIEVGQARSEIKKELNPESTAKAIIAVIVAIRVLGRGVFEESSLRMMADEGKRLIS